MTTLNAVVLTSPRDDAIQLYRAFKGFGCDTSSVIKILAHRDAAHRAMIQQEYRTMYSEDILKRLESELTGSLERAVILWIHDPARRDAIIAIRALSRDTVNLWTANEVICSRTPSQIQVFKHIYYSISGVTIEEDIELRATGDHRKLLVAYVSSLRYEGREVDGQLAVADAEALYRAGEKRYGTDEKTFIRIFSERSSAQLLAAGSEYSRKYGKSIEKAVKKETSGEFRDALLTILRNAENPAKYFAKVLNKAMKGLGTDDTTLIRVIVTRTEIDMRNIMAEYNRKFKKSLNEAVRSETSGPYRTFLLSLLGSS